MGKVSSPSFLWGSVTSTDDRLQLGFGIPTEFGVQHLLLSQIGMLPMSRGLPHDWTQTLEPELEDWFLKLGV